MSLYVCGGGYFKLCVAVLFPWVDIAFTPITHEVCFKRLWVNLSGLG